MSSATTKTGAPAWLLVFCTTVMPFATFADSGNRAAVIADATAPGTNAVDDVRQTTLIDAALRPDVGPRPELIGTTLETREAIAQAAAVNGCSGPGADALAAVLPVATDHGSHASGVVFQRGRVLTAAHAVEGASRFFVRTDEDFRRADLISVDHEADLAVLAIDTGDIQPLPLAGAELTAEEPVWAVGFPRARALETTSGVFQRVSDGAVHTSASIDSGQSGGGLLSCTGGEYAIAGMLRGYGAYRSGDRYVKLDNHSVSVAARTIQHFLSVSR